ncbi:MAG: type II toxin-antitoxin system RelE/ParE family toxin [Isosphaeraceae bacterium]
MRKTFIESGEFTKWVKSYLADEDLAALQRELLTDPEEGDVMPGCGGLRKLRVADPKRGKGRRGGARVVYLHIAEADVIDLMDVYGKDEQEDLTADQKKILKALADRYKRAVLLAARSFRRGPS